MIDIFELYNDFKSQVNMNQGGYLSPGSFESYVNTVTNDLLKQMFEHWQKNQSLTDSMYHLLKSVNITVQSLQGKPYDSVTLPSDYAFFSSARVVYNPKTAKGYGEKDYNWIDGCTGKDSSCAECTADNKYIDPDMVALEKLKQDDSIVEGTVTIVTNDRWGAKLAHRTKGPKVDNPAITQYDGGFKIAPKNVGVMILDYIRRPEPAKFAYTLDADDVVIYDANNSIGVDWPIEMKAQILPLIIKKYATAIGDDKLYAIGNNEAK